MGSKIFNLTINKPVVLTSTDRTDFSVPCAQIISNDDYKWPKELKKRRDEVHPDVDMSEDGVTMDCLLSDKVLVGDLYRAIQALFDAALPENVSIDRLYGWLDEDDTIPNFLDTWLTKNEPPRALVDLYERRLKLAEKESKEHRELEDRDETDTEEPDIETALRVVADAGYVVSKPYVHVEPRRKISEEKMKRKPESFKKRQKGSQTVVGNGLRDLKSQVDDAISSVQDGSLSEKAGNARLNRIVWEIIGEHGFKKSSASSPKRELSGNTERVTYFLNGLGGNNADSAVRAADDLDIVFGEHLLGNAEVYPLAHDRYPTSFRLIYKL